MSWNLNFIARSKGAAQKFVEQAVARDECPKLAGESIIAHIELFSIPTEKVLHVEAIGHADAYYGTADLKIRLLQRAEHVEGDG